MKYLYSELLCYLHSLLTHVNWNPKMQVLASYSEDDEKSRWPQWYHFSLKLFLFPSKFVFLFPLHLVFSFPIIDFKIILSWFLKSKVQIFTLDENHRWTILSIIWRILFLEKDMTFPVSWTDIFITLLPLNIVLCIFVRYRLVKVLVSAVLPSKWYSIKMISGQVFPFLYWI